MPFQCQTQGVQWAYHQMKGNVMTTNTAVNTLPLVARLGVISLGTKCENVCGACIFCKSFGKEICAELASEEDGE